MGNVLADAGRHKIENYIYLYKTIYERLRVNAFTPNQIQI